MRINTYCICCTKVEHTPGFRRRGALTERFHLINGRAPGEGNFKEVTKAVYYNGKVDPMDPIYKIF